MLSTPLTKSILRTTDNYIKALAKAGFVTVWDLLEHYPRDYEDRTEVIQNFSLINVKEKNTCLVKLLSLDSKKTAGNKILTKAVFEDDKGFMAEAVWFNRKYFANQMLPFVWKKILVTWKVKYAFWTVTFQSPDTETDLSKVAGEILPVYSDINYIPSKWIQPKIILLQKYIGNYSETLPDNIVQKYGFISKGEAIYKIHFPKNTHDIEQAKQRLAYEELYEINFWAISKKYQNFAESEWKSMAIELDVAFVKEILKKFPFELTNHQKIVLFQIFKDMEKTHAMQRLLEWDVGTGKTAVALVSAIHAILRSKNRIQVAIMAPTEILARQHFSGTQNMLFEFGISSELLVWSVTAKNKKRIKDTLVSGNLDVIIGTHALVQEDVLFHNLGYVVIDEQHRFWVKQRGVLESWLGNRSGLIPHNLNMTATPIPRTLALTLYGDQDLSIISEYPKGRKDIFTKVAKTDADRKQIELFIRNQLEKGRQVFWVSPLVEESEKIDLANAISTYESLVEIFAPFTVWLVHGKMKAKEKEQVMQDFKDNKIQILSSTTVIEVWVDIPNASLMCIEWAERFGLSSLHQIRGRVWRGEHQSYCYLFPSKWNYTDRLKAMEKTNNGFELSEIDLEIRWPWEVYGLRQSWVPDLKVADLRDLQLISQIREDIEEMFDKKNNL